nr:MAG TPA: hypothetical protein [Bacteriophage sp.]
MLNLCTNQSLSELALNASLTSKCQEVLLLLCIM